MLVKIHKCNNIEEGQIDIVPNALNIKYAINGTGKSTIGKAISAYIENDVQKINELTPFKYLGDTENNKPSIEGIDEITSVKIFDEEYVNQYIFQQDELIKDSFEVFVRTQDYDTHLNEIDKLLSEINVAFQEHPELNSLIQAFSEFIDGFGKAKSGYSAAGAIGKGLGKGNKISNIPEGLEAYSPYLKNSANVKWLKWQMDGKAYLDVADQCPYCSSSIEAVKPMILKVSEEFDARSIEQLNKMVTVFEELLPYFSQDTADKVREIVDNVSGISDDQKQYLLEIKRQVENLLDRLNGLKRMGFHSFKNTDKIANELQAYKIDISFYSHLQSEVAKSKIDTINSSLDAVLESAGRLQGEVAQQRELIKRTIEQNSSAINEFMRCAGYNYTVSIEESDEKQYRMVLSHQESTGTVNAVKNHLSYGERNAFALVLFMYSAIKDNPDIIILDDPISSFDGNKKFAIINMLFMKRTNSCLKDRTVLLLTHEFSTVIDVIYTLPRKFPSITNATFLTIKNNILQEKGVTKSNIQSFKQIALTNIENSRNSINKLIYLRRLLEIDDPYCLGWHLLSNLFHKREVPLYPNGSTTRNMSDAEITEGTNNIHDYVPDFDYKTELAQVINKKLLTTLYAENTSNYEKLQLYRIIFNENNSSDIIKKFVNETFHIENDYLFQLNPREFDTVPQYIISECDRDIFP